MKYLEKSLDFVFEGRESSRPFSTTSVPQTVHDLVIPIRRVSPVTGDVSAFLLHMVLAYPQVPSLGGGTDEETCGEDG